MMHTFRTNGVIKVKMPIKVKISLNLLKRFNLYQCELTITQNMKNIKTLGVSSTAAIISKISSIIVINKIPENIEI